MNLIKSTAALGIVGMALAGHAQVPEGTYKGINEYIDSTVTITLRGARATMETLKDGYRRTYEGTYDDISMTFGGAIYSLKREGSGIRVTLRSNSRNTSYYARTSSGWSTSPSKPRPGSEVDHHEGTYKGYSNFLKGQLKMTIKPNGDAVCLISYDNGKSRTLRGSYDERTSALFLEEYTYSVGRSSRGLMLLNRSNPRDQVTLAESQAGVGGSNDGGYGDSHENWGKPGDVPPSWLVGNWKGTRWDGAAMALNVDKDGRTVADYIRTESKDFDRVTGTFRSSSIYLGRDRFTVRRLSDLSIRLFYVGTQYTVDLYRN